MLQTNRFFALTLVLTRTLLYLCTMKLNLIVLHGAIGSETQLRPLINKLEENFTVYSFNFYGHGGDKINEEFSIEIFSKQLHDFILHQVVLSLNV